MIVVIIAVAVALYVGVYLAPGTPATATVRPAGSARTSTGPRSAGPTPASGCPAGSGSAIGCDPPARLLPGGQPSRFSPDGLAAAV